MWFFFDCLCRADESASAAAVAQVGKDQNSIGAYKKGVVLAKLSALPASIAHFFVHYWNRNVDYLSLVDCGFQENVGVGLLHVTVEKLNVT